MFKLLSLIVCTAAIVQARPQSESYEEVEDPYGSSYESDTGFQQSDYGTGNSDNYYGSESSFGLSGTGESPSSLEEVDQTQNQGISNNEESDRGKRFILEKLLLTALIAKKIKYDHELERERLRNRQVVVRNEYYGGRGGQGYPNAYGDNNYYYGNNYSQRRADAYSYSDAYSQGQSGY